ncbi:MAG: [acyl-carrier-protein] S-malonyltransferase [Omnitrophica bacterium RIFCSPLOWO2_02_FULL_45_16]|nr:MAG: [acyl-carrier-protein] S-malonyltransferase [Omnitrophica bacterium RIFCSPHIGHO2_02_FULL_46_20]OGW93787.1 MAG: [acyl-carrier-protein] S-malonyltransferase [Omnitrophica bacterium RIFCSPLOWO2_01_FULL_45_24]OGW94132.1 MAG: [acyl-carrier-protein] S-malonyltransferase [Omnitrophica bacterium RIFCSPLOWO2_12_FULL_45_13]OGX00808.1 MAG: [acyl-carrier-protein] S-malonyltransferase [Omnitrophica bacterium RIFCSPLOWO2_02_FULL_45_16]
MVEVAYIFPGQGAQAVGMGKDSYDNFPAAKEVFDKANSVLKIDIKKLCFEGPQEELSTTANSQPAILTASIAALRVYESSAFAGQFTPRFSLGLSLGEYTSLVAAESISFEDALTLVRKRGELMEEASRKNPGKMACILGMDINAVEDLCKGIGCEIANLNCPGQVVVSGKTNNIELLAGLAKNKGAKRVLMLDVSGPFHSSLMTPARDKLKDYIDKIQFLPPKLNFISNVDALGQTDPAKIKANLIAQINSKTLWEESVKLVARSGIKVFLEIGPGQVLKGLLKKIDPKLEVKNFA